MSALEGRLRDEDRQTKNPIHIKFGQDNGQGRYPVSRIEFTANRVCTGQSSDSERARDQWQCAAVTPQVNLSFSLSVS